MVNYAHQGEVIRLQGKSLDFLVLSKDFFNQTGFAVLCPLFTSGSEAALNLRVSYGDTTGIAHLEALKSIDLAARHYKSIGQLNLTQIQNISDAVQSIFDYYPFSAI